MLADFPQPTSRTKPNVEANTARRPIMAADEIEPRGVCASAFAATNPLLDGRNGVAAQALQQALGIIIG